MIASITNPNILNTNYYDSIEWTSSDPAILEIDKKSGILKAKKKGTVTITARYYDGKFYLTKLKKLTVV